MQLVVPSVVAIAVAIDAINWATNIPCLGIRYSHLGNKILPSMGTKININRSYIYY
jgi:hypothetical protein